MPVRSIRAGVQQIGLLITIYNWDLRNPPVRPRAPVQCFFWERADFDFRVTPFKYYKSLMGEKSRKFDSRSGSVVKKGFDQKSKALRRSRKFDSRSGSVVK